MGRSARIFALLCVLAVAGAFAWRQLSRPELTDTGPPREGAFRVATYNLGWLLDEADQERYRRILKVIESLRPDVLAVQEVESKEAFLRVLPSGYEVAIADDPMEDQELGLAVRAPFRIVGDPAVLFAKREYDYAFPGRRNVLEVQVQPPTGETFHVYVVHYKSRSGGRLQSDSARKESSRLLLDYWKQNDRERFVVLGDFNDTPGDDSLNILESGDPQGGRSEQEVGEYLVNLMQPFYEDDYVTQGVFRQYRGGPVTPQVRGASEDNDRLRGMDYSFPADVRVTEALFDQILVTTNLYPSVADVGIYSGLDALTGKSSDVTRNKDGEAYIRRHGDLPSDHLPVYADLRLRR